MDPKHRLACILADVAILAGIDASKEAFRNHSRSLERWNDRQRNAVGSSDVYFFSVAGSLFGFAPDLSPGAWNPLRDLQTAARKARDVSGAYRSFGKRLDRVIRHYEARIALAAL